MADFHAAGLPEELVCGNYLGQHYSKFNKKRFPFLFSQKEIQEDLEVDPESENLKLP